MSVSMTSSTIFHTSVHKLLKGPRLPSLAARASSRSSSVVCRADSDVPPGPFQIVPDSSKPGTFQIAQRIGLDTSEGIFGFTPFSELWTGRLAMAGFTVGVAEELLTGQSILEQIGVTGGAASDALLAALLLVMCTPTAIMSAKTLVDAQSGQMSVRQFQRWSKLFGLKTEDDAQVVAYMKKADGIGGSLRWTGDAPASEWPREDVSLYCVWDPRTALEIEADASKAYAREVEINNGRLAMVGFAAAICAEAASGGGVFSQLTWMGKAVGLLGPESGF